MYACVCVCVCIQTTALTRTWRNTHVVAMYVYVRLFGLHDNLCTFIIIIIIYVCRERDD